MQFTVFSSLSRLKAGGSIPDPDRSPGIEPRSPRDGLNGISARPLRDAALRGRVLLLRRHFDAGHQAKLAPVVSIANIVQEVKTGTDTVTQDLNPSVQLSLSAQDAALTPHAAAGTGFASGRFLTSAVSC